MTSVSVFLAFLMLWGAFDLSRRLVRGVRFYFAQLGGRDRA